MPATIAPIQGPTLFLGDSITVGLPPFVKVQGAKTFISKGGQTSAWLLGEVKAAEAKGKLDGDARPMNAVMLIGTNDVGGGMTAQGSFANILATWKILKKHGLHVIVLTVPPFKGYSGYASRWNLIEAKRQAINTLIQGYTGDGAPDQVLDLATAADDPSRPGYLLKSYDSGDGIHPRKDVLGAFINSAALGLGAPAPVPAPGTVEVSDAGVDLLPTSLVPFIALGAIVMTGAVVLARKARH